MNESQLVHDLVKNQMMASLEALSKIMQKAKNHLQENEINPDHFLTLQLCSDMFNFQKQIQMISDNAKGAVSRLTASEAPVFKDDEKSFEELQERVKKTIEYISSFNAQDFENYHSYDVVFPWNPAMKLNSRDYLISFALPNFYFHLTTAYNLLRKEGVKLGKADYLGKLNWQKVNKS